MKMTQINIASMALPAIVLMSSLFALVQANSCSLEVYSVPASYEICDISKTQKWVREKWPKNQDTLSLKCRKASNSASSRPCSQVLSDMNFCAIVVELQYLGPHSDLMPMDLGVTKECPSGLIHRNFTLRKPNLVEGKDLFPTMKMSPQNTKLLLSDFKVSAGSLSQTSLLSYTNIADEIVLRNIKSNEPIKDWVLELDGKSFSMIKSSFDGITGEGLKLRNGRRLDIREVSFGQGPLDSNSIMIDYNSDVCPEQPISINLMGSLDKPHLMDAGALSWSRTCKFKKLKVTFDMRNNGLWPQIPANAFKGFMESVLKDQEVESMFYFDSIDCCNANNAWLLGLPTSQLFVPCEDVGNSLSQYSSDALTQACQNRNTIPVYVIVIVAVVLITILLIGIGCFYTMYVLPKRKNNQGANLGSAESALHSDQIIETRSDHSGSKLMASSVETAGAPRKSSTAALEAGKRSRGSGSRRRSRSRSSSKRRHGSGSRLAASSMPSGSSAVPSSSVTSRPSGATATGSNTIKTIK